jgi:predicted molibdopterin-dependent oxidoreductase YjgC
MDMRIEEHPILGTLKKGKAIKIEVDGKPVDAFEGEPVAAALMAAGKTVFRYTRKRKEARGVFCAIGQCTDCMMTIDGVPNVRTCVTAVKEGMKVKTQIETGEDGDTQK